MARRNKKTVSKKNLGFFEVICDIPVPDPSSYSNLEGPAHKKLPRVLQICNFAYAYVKRNTGTKIVQNDVG
jgi:hypothetical protein